MSDRTYFTTQFSITALECAACGFGFGKGYYGFAAIMLAGSVYLIWSDVTRVLRRIGAP